MYTFITIVISLIITLFIVWLFAVLHIFDFIGQFGCGGSLLFRIFEVAAVFGVSYFLVSGWVKPKVDRYDYTNSYLTTKMPFSIYGEIEKEPYGKETGKISTDSVLKVIDLKKKGTISWIEAYILRNGKPEHVFVLIPSSSIAVKQTCKYFSYNEKSRSFSEYYNRVDNENKIILDRIQKEFLAEVSNHSIDIKHSANNVVFESVKKSSFIFPENGYFKMFSVSGAEFYYIKKAQKKEFKKIVQKYQEKLNSQIKTYF